MNLIGYLIFIFIFIGAKRCLRRVHALLPLRHRVGAPPACHGGGGHHRSGGGRAREHDTNRDGVGLVVPSPRPLPIVLRESIQSE